MSSEPTDEAQVGAPPSERWVFWAIWSAARPLQTLLLGSSLCLYAHDDERALTIGGKSGVGVAMGPVGEIKHIFLGLEKIKFSFRYILSPI
jgi:hypothetical protein